MENYRSADWTDDILLDLIRLEDDYAAFSEIYQRYWLPLMSAACKRISSYEAAQEIVQDLFVSFFLRRHDIQLKSTVEAYLMGALRNQVFKVYRSQKMHDKYVDALIIESNLEPARPDSLLEAKQLREQIYQAAEKMPDKCREVFLLSRFEHLPNKDIAEKLNISVNTVKRHISRATDILKTEFKDHQLDILSVCMFIYFTK